MTLTKDDFPVGTRVRVTDFAFEDSNPQVGTTGTVVASEMPSTAFVDVRRDGKPADDEFPYRPSELEVIDRATFAVGDHVVYNHTAGGSAQHNGLTGVIQKIFTAVYNEPYAQVKWDYESGAPSHPYLHNLVRVPAHAAPSAATIALLRTDADALDTEARDARQESNDLQKRVWALEEKAANATRLAAQYRNVANDLEARS